MFPTATIAALWHIPKAASVRGGASAATGQAENWGRPSGGTDFPLERTGGGFKKCPSEGRVCGWRVEGNGAYSNTATQHTSHDLIRGTVGGIAEGGDWTVDLSERGFEADIRLDADVTAALSAFPRSEKMGGEGDAQVSVNEMDETG